MKSFGDNLKTSDNICVITVTEAESKIKKIFDDSSEEFCHGITVDDKSKERSVIGKIEQLKNRAFVDILIVSFLSGNGFIPLNLAPLKILELEGRHTVTMRVIELVTERPTGPSTENVKISDIWAVLHARFSKEFEEQWYFFVSQVMKGLIDKNGLPSSLRWMTVGEKELIIKEMNDVKLKATYHSVDIKAFHNSIHFDNGIQTTVYVADYARRIGEEYQPLVVQWNKFGEEILAMCRQVR